jgi:hypothetical protein
MMTSYQLRDFSETYLPRSGEFDEIFTITECFFTFTSGRTVMSRATSNATPASPQQQQNMGIPREKIAMRAYEKWCKRGRPHGSDKQDWVEAEIELKTEMSRAGGMQGSQTQGRR